MCDCSERLSLTQNIDLKKYLKNYCLNNNLIGFEGVEYLKELEFDIFSMDKDSIDLILEHVKTHRPKVIFEFGGGCSSIILSKFIQFLGENYDPLYVNLEDNPVYYNKYKQLSEKYKLNKIVNISHPTLNYNYNFFCNLFF